MPRYAITQSPNLSLVKIPENLEFALLDPGRVRCFYCFLYGSARKDLHCKSLKNGTWLVNSSYHWLHVKKKMTIAYEAFSAFALTNLAARWAY